jgi:putative ABC transport system substrate-binding protein
VAASRLGFLYDAGQPNMVRAYEEARDAAPALSIAIVPLPVRTPEDLTTALATAAGAHLDALFVGGGPLTRSAQARLVDFVSASRLPSMFGASRDPVDAGGLLFYGESLVEGIRGSAVYVHRILRGARPADLPIEVISKFDLIVNMKTAKALGLTIPPSVLAQATELIQ